MIQNTVVFIVNGDGSFFKQPPNTKFTANSVNKNSIFVIAPFVNTASIIANFKVAHKAQQESRVATLTTMQPREITNESYVFDWNVWEVKVPQPTLQFLANNRGSEILVSFNIGETIPSRVIPKFDDILAEITNTDFTLPSPITDDGRYIVKVASYEYENGKYAFFNDTIIADNTEQEYKIFRAKYSGGLTPSVAFKVDPSIPMENFDEYEPSVVEQLILQANENSGEIVDLNTAVGNLEDRATQSESDIDLIEEDVLELQGEVEAHIEDLDNPHGVTAEQVDTYNKTTIDNKDTNTLQEAKGYTNSNVNTHNESPLAHDDIRQLINNLDETKLSKSLTSLVAETELSMSDVFVIDKGSGSRKITLAILAGYLATGDVELFTIVEELPTENQNPNTIYLLATENEDGDNQLLEYIWIGNESRWELIGSLEVDLSNYYTKSEVNTLLESKYNFVSFYEGMGAFDIDKDCQNNTIYLDLQSFVNGTFPVGYMEGGFLIQTQTVSGNEYDVQTLFSPLQGKMFTREILDYDGDDPVWGEWKDHYGDYDNLSNKPTIDQLLGNLSTLGFVKRTGTNTYVIDTSNYQPLDADLTSIAGLSGTSGLLRKTASNTWQLDTSVYLTGITKLMVEAVLTGTITTHTHNASAIVEDASHRFVTDTEKNTWNNKQDELINMLQTELNTGTATTGRTISAKVLRDTFYTKGEIDLMIGDIESLLEGI